MDYDGESWTRRFFRKNSGWNRRCGKSGRLATCVDRDPEKVGDWDALVSHKKGVKYAGNQNEQDLEIKKPTILQSSGTCTWKKDRMALRTHTKQEQVKQRGARVVYVWTCGPPCSQKEVQVEIYRVNQAQTGPKSAVRDR